MHAIEFLAKAQKGIIRIPEEYQQQLQDQFRVIILQDAPVAKSKPRKKRRLTAVRIKTKGLKINRDEANAR